MESIASEECGYPRLDYCGRILLDYGAGILTINKNHPSATIEKISYINSRFRIVSKSLKNCVIHSVFYKN